MESILILFIFLSVFFLMAGLIRPSWAFMKTRKNVLKLYSLIFILFMVIFLAANKETLRGTVEYSISVEGEDTTMAEFTRTYMPSYVMVYFDNDNFRMKETGGTEADVIARIKKNEAFLIDSSKRKISLLKMTNLDETMKDRKVRDLMPYHFKAELKKTGKEDTVCGYECTEYEVIKSGFIRPYAKAKVWITHKIVIPKMRFDFQDDERRFNSPLPLQLGITDGTIIKMIVEESGVVVTYTVQSVKTEKPAENLFVLPEAFYEDALNN